MMNQRALLRGGPAAAAAASEGVVPAHFYRSSLDCLFKVGGGVTAAAGCCPRTGRSQEGRGVILITVV